MISVEPFHDDSLDSDVKRCPEINSQCDGRSISAEVISWHVSFHSCESGLALMVVITLTMQIQW